jgi:prenyltransferase beta subunit
MPDAGGGDAQQRETLEYWVTEHLRVSGLYWGLTALTLLGREDALPREDVIAFLLRCQHTDGTGALRAVHWPLGR